MLAQRETRDAAGWSALAAAYRSLCADLAAARGAEIAPEVLSYLDNLAARAHHALYGARPWAGGRLIDLLFRRVPGEVRAQAGLFWLSFVLFHLPFFLAALGAWTSERFTVELLGADAVEQMRQMYAADPSTIDEGGRASMAGFYVWNNVGIALRCTATGALAGLGSVVTLVSNGAVIGATFGALLRSGEGGNLLAFASGHAAWELLGIVLSGAAGLRIGWALIEPDGRSRADSVRQVAPSVYLLVVGAGFLLLVAAAIEAFWSAGPAPAVAKYVFGVAQYGLVGAWLLLGGREAAR